MKSPQARDAGQKIINSPPVVLILIAVLLAIHLALTLAGGDWPLLNMAIFGFNPLRLLPGTTIGMQEGSPYWSFITYAFLHADWMHVIVNCIWLLIFGTPVARLGGPARFLAISAIGAIGGAIAMLVTHWGQDVNVIGASGAVAGLLAAAVPIIYGGSTPRRFLSPGELVRSRRSLTFIAITLAIMLIFGSADMTAGAYEGLQIAWEAHIGGFVAGLIAFYLVMPSAPKAVL